MSDDKSELFYEHSGRLGLSAPVILLVGLPFIVALSALYSYIVVYCPVVGYVNVLFLFGYVLIGGAVLGKLGTVSKCRSPGLLTLLGLVAGLVGLYFAWVFFIKALLGEEVSVIAVALQPTGVWRTAQAINADGWWGPSGIAQWALVSIEALIIVGGLALITSASISREVFCEDCGTWCKPFDTIHLKPTEEMLSGKAEELDHLKLLALEPTEATEYPRFDAEVLQCSGCQMTQAIRLKIVTQITDDGELKEQVEDLPGILMQKKMS